MSEYLLSKTEQSVDIKNLAKDAFIALVIQVVGLVLTYLLQVCLARWMGRTEYGIYEYVVAWSLILAIFFGLGLPRTSVRLISEYRVTQDWASLRGIVRGSWQLTFFVGLGLCALSTALILLADHYHHFIYAIPLIVGMGLVLLQGIQQLQSDTARALEGIPLAYLPFRVAWPGLVLLAGFFLHTRQVAITGLEMIEVATVMLLIVIAIQGGLLRNKISRDIEPASPTYHYRQWLGISLVLLLQRAFFVVLDQTDVVMVGSLVGPAAAGVYNAAVKTALWVGFVLEIVILVVAPAFTILYKQGDFAGLQRLVNRVTGWIFWPSLGVSIGILIFAQPLLSLFGPGFVGADLTLRVLVWGRLVDSLCGTVACLLIMTGNQNRSLPIFAASALMNIGLNAIAIPRFGITGAAMATSFTLIVWNIWMSWLAIRAIGINPTIFASLTASSSQE